MGKKIKIFFRKFLQNLCDHQLHLKVIPPNGSILPEVVDVYCPRCGIETSVSKEMYLRFMDTRVNAYLNRIGL